MKREFLICGPIVLMTVAMLGFTVQQSHKYHLLKEDDDMLRTQAMQLYHKVQTANTDYMSVQQALRKATDKNTNLEGLLAHMQTPEPEIRYITKTQVVIKASEPQVTFKTPPEHYTHFLDDGIAVADFTADDTGYHFKTYDLSFRSTLIIGKQDNSVLVQVASSSDNQWHEVSSELTVIDTHKEYPAIRPSLHIGIGSNTSGLIPEAIVSVPIFEATDSLDFAAPAISIGAHPSGSILLVGFNIGKPLPILDDLWVWTGPSINLEAEPGVELALTTKF